MVSSSYARGLSAGAAQFSVRLARLLPSVLLISAVVACDDATTRPSYDETPAKIQLSAATLDLDRGDTTRISAVVLNRSGSPIASPSAGLPRHQSPVKWTSSDPSIANISRSGLILAHRSGDVTLQASVGSLTSSASLSVQSKGKSITVSPKVDTLHAIGHTLGLSVTVLNGSGKEQTNPSVNWSSLDPLVASVDSNGLVTALAAGAVLIVATAQGQSDTAEVVVRGVATAPLPVVASVEVAPDIESADVGVSKEFKATVKDGSGEPMTDFAVVWSSSDHEVATVSSTGVVTAKAPGSAKIRATADDKSGSAVLTVVDDSAPPPSEPPPGEEDSAPPSGAVSVTDFGAVGDGRTDNTGAFREAIESAGRNKNALYIPAGRYLITSSLTIDYGVEFVGDGHEKSVITSNKGTARLMVRQSGTAFRDLGFEDMVEPIALVSREGYVLENLRFERCRFERMVDTNTNRGVIGLSSGNSSQRPHRIHKLVVKDCIFRNIDARAINIRANISEAQILNNQFLDIISTAASPAGGSAIKLGEDVTKDVENEVIFAAMVQHLVEGNVIRKMRKSTSDGNLIGILLYGGNHTVQNNLIEDIDGTAEGLDVNGIYIKGFSNQILLNTIRNIRGADDDGALCIKAKPEYSRDNVVAQNLIENVYGMSAAEMVTTNLQFYQNTIRNASTRGFYHRMGENLDLRDNTFENATALLRTDAGVARVTGNRFVKSGIVLSQFSTRPAEREAVYIHDNVFERTDAGRTIGLGNDVVERLVSLERNTFRAPSTGENIVDLLANGTVHSAERKDNVIEGPFTYRGP